MSTSNYLFEEGNVQSLENLLLKAGLTKKEIQTLKSEKNNFSSRYFKQYSKNHCEKEKKSTKKLVPVNRIIGIDTGRGTKGESWFENLLNYRLHTFRETTVNYFLTKMVKSIDDFRKSFMLETFSDDNLKFAHFLDEDIYVSAGSGGSHRTLFAKICGASYILAEVCVYKRDKRKVLNYNKFESKKEELITYVKKLGFEIIDTEIKFKNHTVKKCIISNINDFSNDNDVYDAMYQIECIINDLILLEKEYIKYHKLPEKLMRFVLKFKLLFNHTWELEQVYKLIKNGWEYK